ncbi:unnamed protein product [Adineta steineri]|uniref:Uncharacterized protein n=2 Tax=Adineta steineri TaxID=433720 RepID=A0A819HFV4_9BILA|nr:unnamed protein product [Adineta steineri]
MLLPIFYFIYIHISGSYSGTCDMQKAENRDFNKFYGIEDLRNHFTITAADACDSDILFKPVLPQAVLKADHSASSFMILAKYGTGKTLLRCEYYKSLNSNNYFKILILNRQINEYLETFVSGTSPNGKDCESRDCLIRWSKHEFAQLMLSVLVTEFVDQFQKEENFYVPNISLDEKFQIISILCYYYNGQGVSKLEKLVNFLLNKTNNSMYTATKAESQILERNVYRDKPVLTHLKQDLNKFNALRKDYDKLHLLLSIVEGEGFQSKVIENTMFDNVFNHLTCFTVFIKTNLKKSVVVVIDGIDENRYFFTDNLVNKLSLELFLRSSVSQEILSSVMAHNFYLSLFYPEIDGINIQDMISRNDEFSSYTINWNTKSLINYADYVLQEMNKNASTNRCVSFSSFKTLVNYSNQQSADIINRITTPRALHYFMEKLVTEMNNCVNDSTESFIATVENVANAYNKSIHAST